MSQAPTTSRPISQPAPRLVAAPDGPTPRAAGAAPTGPAGRRPASSPRQRPRRGGTDGVRGLVADFVRLFCEVEAGRRPAAQLAKLMSPRLHAQLAPVWVRPGAPAALLQVSGRLVSSDRYEACAVVRRGERVGAIAVCLQHRDEGWRVVAAGRPEDGPLPKPRWTVPEEEPDAFDLVAESAGPTTPSAEQGGSPVTPAAGEAPTPAYEIGLSPAVRVA